MFHEFLSRLYELFLIFLASPFLPIFGVLAYYHWGHDLIFNRHR